MKHLLVLLTFNTVLFYSYSQDLLKVKNPMVYTIGGDSTNLYCLQQTIDLDVLDWVYDSCDYYRNRFNLTFQVHNETNETLVCDKNHIVWYDAGSSIRSSGSIAVSPGETKTFTIEVIPYNKSKMNARGQLSIQTTAGQLLIPMRLIFTCSSKKCYRNTRE